MAGPPFWFDAWWLYRESPVLPTRFRLIDWLRAVASLDFYSFHCFYLPPFLCFSFTICCSRRRSSFLVIASSRLCMVWDLWEGKDEQVCVKGSSQGCQWNSKTWDDDWFCYSIVSSEGKPNEIWKVTGEFRLERRGMTHYLMVAIQKVGKWVLRYMHIPAGLFILVVTSAIFSLRRSLRRQKPHPFVIPLCSNNISFIPHACQPCHPHSFLLIPQKLSHHPKMLYFNSYAPWTIPDDEMCHSVTFCPFICLRYFSPYSHSRLEMAALCVPISKPSLL